MSLENGSIDRKVTKHIESGATEQGKEKAVIGQAPGNIGVKKTSFQEKLEKLTSELKQITTRGDGTLELKEPFNSADIDFGSSLEHLKIHHDGEVAGSQLNGELFSDPKEVETMLKKLLPTQLNYDQFDRVEMTLDIKGEEVIGWSGVKSVEEIRSAFPGAVIEKRVRIPGGTEDVLDGTEGAWYPETARNSEGRFEVVVDASGNINNPKAKFEPKANIVQVPKEQFQEVSKTNKLTVIMQKDKQTGRPVVLTVFPGENAPAYPAKIDTETYKANSLGDTKETKFWEEYAFVQGV